MTKLTQRWTGRLSILIAAAVLLTGSIAGLNKWKLAANATSASAKTLNPQQESFAEARAKATARSSFGKLPLAFEANQGQTDARVKYMSRAAGYTVFLTGKEAVLSLKSAPGTTTSLAMQLDGAQDATIEPVEQLPGKTNYLVGERKNWRTDVPQFAKIRYHNIYPGIDTVYQGSESQFRYDFVVNPGADPKAIRMHFAGAEQISLTKDGELSIAIGGQTLINKKPYIYQNIKGGQKQIAGNYKLSGDRIGFEVASYDASKPLIIDPTVVVATYIGRTTNDSVLATAINGTGVYLTGVTTSADFPTTVGVVRTTPIGLQDVFVAKLNLAGNLLLWSTYLGGTNTDSGNAIAVDSANTVWVAGNTFSSNFGGLTNTYGGGTNDGFVLQLNAAGTAILLGQYVGGNTNDIATGIVLDNGGVAPYNTYISGYTDSANFPVTTGVANRGSSDAFIGKIAAGGATVSALATYGGAGAEFARGIGVWQQTQGGNGNVYIAGDTTSNNLPVTDATSYTAGRDPFFIVANPSLAAVTVTYLYSGAATGDDTINAITVDPQGRAIFAGQTTSAGLSTGLPVGTVYQPALSSQATANYDCWAGRIDFSSATFNYVTYFGAAGSSEICRAVATDTDGQIYVAGDSILVLAGPNALPTTNAAVTSGIGVGGFTITANASVAVGEQDAFLARFNPNAAGILPVATAPPQLNFSNFFYGTAPTITGVDFGNAVAVSPDRTTVFAGQTFSAGIATSAPTYQTIINNSGTQGQADGYEAEVAFNDIQATPNGITTVPNPALPAPLNAACPSSIAGINSSPASCLFFNYADTDAVPVTQTFVVQFTGTTLPFTLPISQAQIDYQLCTNATCTTTTPSAVNWLNLPTPDVTPGVVRVSVNTGAAFAQSLAEGTYKATFNVTTAGNPAGLIADNVAVPVRITLVKRPNMSLTTNGTLTYTYDINTALFLAPGATQPNNLTTDDYNLALYLPNTVAPLYRISATYGTTNPAGQNWLQVSRPAVPAFTTLTGTEITSAITAGGPTLVPLTYRVCPTTNPPGPASLGTANACSVTPLAPGTYTATVTVASDRAKNSPQTFTVVLNVVNTGQQIQLTPNFTPTLYSSQVQQIFATVANSNPFIGGIFTAAPDSVLWSLTGFGAGCTANAPNAAFGTLSNNGPTATTTYTAPAGIAAAAQTTVTACRPNPGGAINPTIATLLINLAPSPSLAPAGPITLYQGQAQQFVTNNAPGSTVSYAIVGGSQTGSAIGSSGVIGGTSGIYLAPTPVTAPGSLQVQATITGAAGAVLTTPVTINLLPPSTLTIAPASATLYQGQTQQLTPTTTNPAGNPVTYTLAGSGTVTAGGLFTAPASVPVQSTTTITASSTFPDGVRTSVSNITLVPLGAAACTPAILYGTQTSTCTAQTINPPVWSVAGGGTISASTGVYTAPAAPLSPLTVTVTATDGATIRTGTITVLPASAITIVPALTSLYANGSFLFAASVVNANGVQPTWTVSAGLGTISSTGQYTAPPAIAANSSATITATLATADGPRTATATVNLLANPVMTPASVNLYASQSQQFTATAPPAGFTLTYTASEGTINPTTGLYTAPSTVTTQHAATVTATITTNLGAFASSTTSTVNLFPASTLAISPTSTSLKANQTQQFTSTTANLVPGTPAVTYAVLNPSPLTGTINAATGLYTAPGAVTAPLAVTVRATLAALDGTRTADAIVNLVPPAGVTVTPTSASLYATQTQPLTANSTPSSGFTDVITWTVTGAGSLNTTTGASVTFTAPATVLTSQSVTVTASAFNAADGTRTASAVITLVPAVSVSIAPATSGPLYPPGTALQSSQTLTATVLNSTNPTVTWTLVSGPGSISGATGTTVVYTAPAAPGVAGTAVIMATATTPDPSGPKTATATVTVSPQVGVTVTPNPAVNIFAGQTQQFSATVANATNTAVTFSVSGGGSINAATGLYSAPASGTLLSQIAVTVTATSVFDSTKSSSVTFQVAPSAGTVFDYPRYVKRLYIDFLGRVPDASGNTFWVTRLQNQVETSQQVGQDFFNSPEFKLTGQVVANAYVGLLGRDPDYAGFTFWLNSIRGGSSQTTLFNTFVNSPEFTATYGNTSNDDFIRLLYLNTLQRAATAGDVAFWSPQVATLGRATIAGYFITSDEFSVRFRTRQLSNLLYLGFLGRTPDPLGRQFWTNELNQGVSELTVIGNFIGSLEYLNRLATTTLP